MSRNNAAIDHSDVLVGMTPIVTTLLVVDDDPIQRRVISKIGAQAGHRTLVASSLETAIVTLESEHVDLISVDIGLGADSGLDLLQFVAVDGPRDQGADHQRRQRIPDRIDQELSRTRSAFLCLASSPSRSISPACASPWSRRAKPAGWKSRNRTAAPATCSSLLFRA